LVLEPLTADELLQYSTETSESRLEESILTVDQLISQSLEQNQQLQRQLGEIRFANAQLEAAYAERLPTLNFSLKSSYLTAPQDAVIVEAGSLATVPVAIPDVDLELFAAGENTYFQLKTEISQPIFTWGKINRGIDLAAVSQQISELQYEASEAGIIRDVKQAYAAFTLAKDSEQILLILKELGSQSYADRQRQFEQGNINRQSLLQAQSQFAQIEFEFLKSQQLLQTALLALEFYTGNELDPQSLQYRFRTMAIELNSDNLEQAVIMNNYDLAELQLLENQAELSVQFEEASQIFRPTLGANITLDINGQSVPFTENWEETWNVNFIFTLGTDFTILDFGKSWASLEQAQAQLDQASAGQREFILSIPLQVQQRIEQIRINYADIQNQSIALELQKEQYNNVKTSFENDLITSENFRAAAILLLQTNLNLIKKHL
jgi:outer membrane protein